MLENQKAVWNSEYRLNKDKWKKETANVPKIMKGKIILELGVGNGKTLISILRQHPKKVVAIDFSSKAIEMCRKSFSSKSIIFKITDMNDLPFKNKEFDVIVCYYVLNNLLDKNRDSALDEISRVLKSDGKIVFEDFAAGDFRERGNFIGKHTIRKKNGLICHFFTAKKAESILKENSVEEVNYKGTIHIEPAY